MDFTSACYTATGTRPNNEDTVFCRGDSDGILAIVADGLGGHANGEIASGLAVSTISQSLHALQPNEGILIDSIRQASAVIHKNQSTVHSMHTTVAALWLNNDCCIAAHIGDSRIYQFRNGEIIYQSRDHSVAQMAVLVGELKQQEIRTSPKRNRLIRVLGNSDTPVVDSRILSVQDGDRFLLCSDGFWEAVTEEEMLQTIATSDDAESWLAQMRECVNMASNPSQDNHSAITIIINKPDVLQG